MLSDRATLRLEHGGELDAEMTPASLYTRSAAALARAHVARRADARDALSSRGADGDSALLQRSAELDALQLALSAAVSSSSTDLAVAYLPGLDIAQHALLGGQGTAVAASTLAARLQSVKDYYVALDRLLSAHGAVEPRGDEAIVILTQPGRVGASVSGRLAARGRLLSASRSQRHVDGHRADAAPRARPARRSRSRGQARSGRVLTGVRVGLSGAIRGELR